MGEIWSVKTVLLFRAFRNFFLGILFLGMACLCFNVLSEVSLKKGAFQELETLPDHNYIPQIVTLQELGRLEEALELTKFVIAHPQLPGQREAKQIEEEINKDLGSHWGKAKRFSTGFIRGSSGSGEELAGAIASDMVIWGDIRDLAKQGYLKIRGEETDPVLAALAGVGLLTEVIDAADWAPAVLKLFRKLGALSEEFTSYLISACKKSVKGKCLDTGLSGVFTNLKQLNDNLGSARTVEVFKHVDGPEALAALAKSSQKDPDAIYLTVKNSGPAGVGIVQQLGTTDEGVAAMAAASNKGPLGIPWLQPGGKGHHYVVKTRVASRALKNLHLGRFHSLLKEVAQAFPLVIVTASILSLLFSLFFFFRAHRNFGVFLGARKRT